MRVTIDNPGKALAFMVRLKITRERGGDEVLPILWQDNYFSLIPGERRDITATFAAGELKGSSPFVEVQGWNVVGKSISVGK